MTETNEFDDLSLDDLEDIEIPSDDGMGDFGGTAETVKKTNSGNSNISNENGMEEYDFNNAPSESKAPPRIDLDGKTITVTDVKLLLPSTKKEWTTSRKNKDIKYKSCILKVFYSEGGQQENYSGVNVFRRDGDMYSHPTISTKVGSKGPTQATALLQAVADFKGKDINTVSLKEFLNFLKSQPKAVIKATEVENPDSGEKIKKNMIGKFVN